MHDRDINDLATIAALHVRLSARAQTDVAQAVNEICSASMAALCIILDVDGAEVRARATTLLEEQRALCLGPVH